MQFLGQGYNSAWMEAPDDVDEGKQDLLVLPGP